MVMRMKSKRNKKTILITAIAGAAILTIGYFTVQSVLKNSRSSGRIFLYGEQHSVENILKREAELWSSHYHKDGFRDLFVELPYYSAEYLNIWMKSDDDAILDSLYEDWAGTALYSQVVLDFYRQIKSECPETVFHGTDRKSTRLNSSHS